MPMLAEIVDAVVGGDTHKHTHTLEMLTPAGVILTQLEITNDETGYAQAAAWITASTATHVPTPDTARVTVGLEGTRSYGLGLARALTAAGFTVLEIERPTRAQRRGRGKSDPIDAHLAALQLLRMDTGRLPVPRADGDREALRILLTGRRELSDTQTRHKNQLRALLLGGDALDRDLASSPLSDTTLQTLIRRRATAGATREHVIRRGETRRLAQTIRDTARALKTNLTQLRTIINDTAPGLLEHPGIGPVSAAQAIVSYSHRGRCRNDAAFAALAGASPIPASSGKTVRHRLNRGGDRQLNRALHTIALTRWRDDPRTHAYIERRRAQGHTDRDIRRNLKRYIARELFRTLNATITT